MDTSQSKLVRVWGDQTKHFSCPLRQSQRQQWAFLLERSTFQRVHSRHSSGKVRVTGWPLSYIFYVGGQEPLKSVKKKKKVQQDVTPLSTKDTDVLAPSPAPHPQSSPRQSQKSVITLWGLPRAATTLPNDKANHFENLYCFKNIWYYKQEIQILFVFFLNKWIE